jgi:hypothetical protein
MANRIKTLVDYGGVEWRNDLKLAALTVFWCTGLILFFSADSLVGAMLLRVIYFQYGTLVALILIAAICFVFMSWAKLPLHLKLIGIGVYVFVAITILFLTSPKLLLLISYLAGFILGIGSLFFVPITILIWVVIGIIAWIRGYFREYLTEPFLIRMFIAGLLIFTACYASVRYVQSLDFTIVDHKAIASENFYTISFTSVSSDVSGGMAYYKCNTISVSCTGVSASEQLKETQ